MKNQSLVRSFLLLVALALGASLVPLARVEAATNVPCDTTALVNAIQDAVNAGGSQTLKLAKDCNYVLTDAAFGGGTADATGLPKINKVKLTIKGNGATIKRKTNAPAFRLMFIARHGEVTLNNLTLRGGKTFANKDGSGLGGAIYLLQGTLTLKQVTVTNNETGKPSDSKVIASAAGYGGGIANFKGELTVLNSQITNNIVGDSGNSTGQLGGRGEGGGGIYSYYGMLTIDASTIDGNRAGKGGNGPSGAGGGGGGGIYATHLRITNSTVSNNQAGKGGDGTSKCGAGGGSGGGIFAIIAVIANTTISGNQAGDGGTENNTTGWACGSDPFPSASGGGLFASLLLVNNAAAGDVYITNSTIAGNRAGHRIIKTGSQYADGRGGNIYSYGSYTFGYEVYLRNTLLGASGLGDSCAVPGGAGQISANFVNVANNLDAGTTCGFGSANNSKSNANANLGPLQDNGGDTPTHALQPGSQALDAGSDAICAAAVGAPNYGAGGKDQRDVSRPQFAHCDIGAYEHQAPPTATPTTTSTPTQTPSPTPTQPPSGVCAGPSAGRISCWKGENNANDSIGTNHGTPQNGATYAAGKVGQAFHLNGSNQYILTTNATNLNFERTNAFSIGTWIRTTGTTNNVMIATKQVNSGQYHGYGLMITNGEQPACDPSNPAPSGGGQLSAFLDGASNSTCPPDFYVGVRATPKLNDGQWHYVAMTYAATSTAAGINLYVDGALQSSVVMADTLGSHSILNSVPFTIGSRENGGVPFNGDIDEVQVWNRALSAQEIVGLAGVSGGDCAGPSNGRISCWKGETNANDSVGSNNGSAQGGATFAAGKVGQAFSFNGTTGHVLVPDSSTLDVTTQFTMSAWVKPASLMTAPPFPGKGAILSKIGGGGGNNGYQYGLADDNKGLWCQFNAQGEPWPANQVKGNVTGLVPLNTWTHVACTYDHANLTVYVNGSAVGTLAVGPKTVNNTSSNLRISSDDNGNVYFDGLIDEAQVWNRALSAQEIKDVYNGSGGSSCTDKPEKPTLKVPADGTIINTTQPKLKWNQAGCATTYNVTIQDSLGQTVAKETGLTKLQYSPLLTAGYTYKWFVQAVNEHGKTKSAAWTFFIQ